MGTNSSLIQSKIGNPFFSTSNDKDSELNLILSQFQLVSNHQDPLFKRCTTIRHKTTKQLIVAKEIDCKDETQMNNLFEQFNRRKQTLTSQNLVRLRYALKKKTDGIFADQYKIILLFDYIFVDLQTEYFDRKKSNKYFTADQINVIMAGSIRGYAALQALKFPNTKVRLSNIYFGLIQNGGTVTKIVDSKLFPDMTNIQMVLNKQKLDGVYLAPQQLRLISTGQSKSQKSGVYSLGICLMQICLLQSCRQIYSYSTQSVNYIQLQTRLNVIKNKYPLSIFYLIRQMLERNQDSRLSFTKLAQKIPTNVKLLPNSIALSVMKRTQNKFGQASKFGSSTKFRNPVMQSKLINPTIISRSQRKMQTTTLASQYRPAIDASQVYTNGNMYTGQKKEGLRHGKGKYTYSDGSYYFGDWFKGKMQGQGQLYDNQGNLQYQGEWKDDHYQGRGKIFNFSGDWSKYEGQFVAGRKQGFGQLYFRDGNKYKGQFRNDFPWGKGRMFKQNGQIKGGIWEKGVFIRQA